MTITLINATRRMKVFNLPHQSYCAAIGACTCSLNDRGKLIASSLTLPAGSTTPGLHEAVLQLADVARDIRTGELRVRREAPSPKPTNRSRKLSRRSGRKNAR